MDLCMFMHLMILYTAGHECVIMYLIIGVGVDSWLWLLQLEYTSTLMSHCELVPSVL